MSIVFVGRKAPINKSRSLTVMLLGILAAAALTCARSDDPARIDRVENRLTSPVRVKGDGTWNILERMKHYGVPGVSIAVFDKHRVRWAKGYGVMDAETKEPVTEKTLFVAGSISKPVAAMGALKLVEEGKIGLDTNINASLTSWKLPENELTRDHPVTLRQLLSHSGGTTVHGFRGYAKGEAVPTILQILEGLGNTPAVRADLEPGKQWRYSGGGITVMQLALMDVEKTAFPEILRTKVLEPIGMTSSSYEQTFTLDRLKLAASGYDAQGRVIPGKRFKYPEMAAAGLWTTPTDLAKFAIEVELSARGKSNKVLSKETAALMLKPQIPIGGSQEMALGLFLELNGAEVYFGHGGEDVGFIARLIAHRDGGYGAAIMTNSDGKADPLINEILRSIAAEYGWKDYLPLPLEAITLEAGALEPLPGRYRTGTDAILTVSLKGGSVYGKETEGEEFELVPISAREFARRDATVRYVFGEAAGGSAMNVTLVFPTRKLAAERVAPGDKSPLELLQEGRFAEAAQGYRGLWKANSNDPAVDAGRINSLGYRLMRETRTAEAVVLFELNVGLYPGSWNAYDSLGEGYAALGKTDLAIKNYEKSLEKNPGNANGRTMLEKLKKQK